MNAPVVAVVGGGQLARMMAPAATALGIHLRVLVESPSGSAGQVVVDAPVGEAGDEAAIAALAAGADALTFEHEHVPNALLDRLAGEGVAVRPDAAALVHAQDKIVMRRRLTALGIPCPRWAPVTHRDDLAAFLADQPDGAAVVKTARGGYDGKGVRVVRAADEADDWLAAAALPGGVPVLVEEKVPYTRELAVLVARRPSGEMRTWPVVESVQRDGVCAEVIAPAPRADRRLADAAARLGVAIAESLGVTGMLAVELFQTDDDRILVNELAMRPHNSGHWTQDGAVTSQFEQHLRAVLDLPLGATDPREPWSVMVNILGGPAAGGLTERFAAAMAAHPEAKIHTYGKAPRPGRKVGHVTVAGADLDDVVYDARAAAAHFLD